jgi:hypothetical protein
MRVETTSPERRALALVLLLFIGLGLAYSIVNPLYEATDELRHYRFIRTLVVNRALPVQGQEPCRSQSHHPPLIYAVSALTTAWVPGTGPVCLTPPENPFWAYRYWDVGVDNKVQYLHGADEAFPWRGDALAAHIARAINVLVGAGTVWVTWLIGKALWPRRPWLALGGTAFVAFNPMFLYMSGAINNDVIAAFSGGLVLLACVRLLRDPEGLSRRWGIWLGASFSLALMSKFNLAAAGLLIAMTVTLVAWRRKQPRLWLEVALLSLATTGLLAGWWFIRNLVLYGEPTGFQELTELWGVRDPRESFGLALSELPYAWSTLWGRFGFGQIPLPEGVYIALRWLALGGLAGLVVGFVRRRRQAWPRGMELLVVDVVLFFLVLFNYMLVSPAGPMGRFFFPALPAFSILLFAGWHQLLGGGARAGRAAAVFATGGMSLFSLAALFGIIAPAYARPPDYDPGTTLPNATDIRFDYFAALRGFDVTPDSFRPGEALDVTLYWEVTAKPPGDYLLFVHVIDEANDTLVAQRDTHPGLGRFPSSQWEPGDRFVDRIRLYLPETAYAPAQVAVQIGLYAPEGYRLRLSDPAGDSLGDALPLAQVPLKPRPGALPNPQDANFNDELRLVGYEMAPRLAAAGEEVTVTLYWEPLAEARTDRQVQVWLLDETGAVVATANQAPPEALLREGAEGAISGRHVLSLAGLSAGVYRVELAVFAADSGRRLPLVAPDGHWIDERLLLPRVRVFP